MSTQILLYEKLSEVTLEDIIQTRVNDFKEVSEELYEVRSYCWDHEFLKIIDKIDCISLAYSEYDGVYYFRPKNCFELLKECFKEKDCTEHHLGLIHLLQHNQNYFMLISY